MSRLIDRLKVSTTLTDRVVFVEGETLADFGGVFGPSVLMPGLGGLAVAGTGVELGLGTGVFVVTYAVFDARTGFVGVVLPVGLGGAGLEVEL